MDGAFYKNPIRAATCLIPEAAIYLALRLHSSLIHLTDTKEVFAL